MRPASLLCLAIALAPGLGLAQTVYPTSPDWVSADGRVATGATLVDLDRDGWLDLVVSNGNDMEEQPLVVFYNQGDGTFPANPDWVSGDTAYNGHLDVADVNGDGWPDVAVAVLGSGAAIDHAAKLYLNHLGTLSSIPDWQSSEMANAFGCAFGDVNNDGRPDLAVATGETYHGYHYPNYVYVNSNGSLPASATWSSADTTTLQGVLWVDANRDGWLDLVGIAGGADSLIYTNLGGALETSASWHTTDIPGADAIMAVCGDVNRDGYRDLIVADNDQLTGGSGRFRQYNGLAGGYFSTTMGWSYYDGYASAVALADVDGDGDLDLATGAWWDTVKLFLNTGSGLPSTPGWQSSPSTVVEKIVFGDIDRDSSLTVTETFPAADRLYWLSRQPVEQVVAVEVDGTLLTFSQYAVGRDLGWVTVGVEPTTRVRIRYRYSYTPDMAVSNWDAVGNHVYFNRLHVLLFADDFESGNTSGWSAVQPCARTECSDLRFFVRQAIWRPDG